ncbi:MAG: MATE family efflux transporter [Tissierellales bacterium]|jgi:putative MATE family efflux protein|nr:MATE family efflux transporter [Tissierellales bacterium]
MKAVFTKNFSFKEFLKFVAPAIVSMIFLSLYTIVDGVFVSRFIGPDALASINITLPIMNLIFGFGIMLSTGGAAVVSIKMGKHKMDEANKTFTLVVLTALAIGIPLGIIGFIFVEPIAVALGATDKLLPFCVNYGKWVFLFMPIFITKALFEFFVRADGRFNFSMMLTILGGIINIILDYTFIKIFGMGIAGAAIATSLGALIPSLIALVYFMSSKSTLKFSFGKLPTRELISIMINGSSEMVTELSSGITTFFFNIIAIKFAGESGLAALTIILYAHFLLVSTYLGFSMGISPLLSYNHGAKNIEKIKETFKYSKQFIIGSGFLIFAIAMIFAPELVVIFVPKSSHVYELACSGLKLFSICFLFCGINICSSGMFTAFSNGKLSSIIALSRSLVFVMIGFAILPNLLAIDGLWLVVPFAEILTLGISIYLLKKYKAVYHY